MTVVFAKKKSFPDFAEQNMNIFSGNANHTLSFYENVSILTLGGLLSLFLLSFN